MTVETIRELLRANPLTPSGFPEVVRDAVARYAQRRRGEGAQWATLEVEVGVSSTSMRKWMGMLTPAEFHEVVVVDVPLELDEPTRGAVDGPLAITSPAGFVLTGVDLEQAIAVLGALR